jgi:hypothetical protein
MLRNLVTPRYNNTLPVGHTWFYFSGRPGTLATGYYIRSVALRNIGGYHFHIIAHH